MSELKILTRQGALFGLAALQSFVLLLYLGRVATPEEVGKIGVILGVLAILVPWLDLGATTSIFRFAFEKRKFISTKEFFSRGVLVTSLAFLITILISAVISSFSELEMTSILFTLTIAWALALNNQITALLRARRFFGLIGFRAVLLNTIILLLFVSFDLLGFKNYEITRLGFHFAALLILVSPFYVRIIRHLSFKNFSEYFSFIKPIMPGAIVVASISASIGYSNRLVTSLTHNPTETGVFVFATSIAALGLMLNQIVNRLYQPLYFEVSANPAERLKDKLEKRLRTSLFASLAVFLLLIVSFDFIFLFLGKVAYEPMLTLGPILVGAVSLQLGYHIFNAKLQYEKRQSFLAFVVFICASVNLFLLFIGGLYFGLPGLAIATCLGVLLQSLAVLRFSDRPTIKMVVRFWLFILLQISTVLCVQYSIEYSLWSIFLKVSSCIPILGFYLMMSERFFVVD